jgi:hypothetical protein
VDDAAFDQITRAIGDLTTRRRILGRLAAAGLALTLGPWGFESEAKPKKCTKPNTKCGKKGCCTPAQQCRGGVCLGTCTFTKTAKRWTLQRDCVSRTAITLPNGVTLDGRGHTIFVQGQHSTLPYGIGALGVRAGIRNLTLDGSGLTSTGGNDRGVGIQFQDASGSIKASAITGFAASSGDAIRVIVGGGAAPQRKLQIDSVSISDALVGINASAINKLTLGVSNSDVKDVKFGMQVQYNTVATLDRNTIAADTYGVVLTALPDSGAAPDVTASNNKVTGAQIGMSVADVGSSTGTPTLTATGNTIVGPGSIDNGATHGLQFNNGTAGSASGNTISNYFNSGGGVGCGIFVAAGADVNVGNNTFPNPPGNEQNVCD